MTVILRLPEVENRMSELFKGLNESHRRIVIELDDSLDDDHHFARLVCSTVCVNLILATCLVQFRLPISNNRICVFTPSKYENSIPFSTAFFEMFHCRSWTEICRLNITWEFCFSSLCSPQLH